MSSAKKRKPHKSLGNLFIGIGLAFCFVAFVILTGIFGPLLQEEVSYTVRSTSKITNTDTIVPNDKTAGIVIPKINANAAIVWDVDPYNANIYQQALTKGVAHAKGSVYPGQTGNVFLFSHSSQDFLTANRYNSVFYLLTKLEKGDKIYLFYQGKPYVYTVTGHDVVETTNTSLMTKKTNEKELTLMTCWPPGTTLKRYIVSAKME